MVYTRDTSLLLLVLDYYYCCFILIFLYFIFSCTFEYQSYLCHHSKKIILLLINAADKIINNNKVIIGCCILMLFVPSPLRCAETETEADFDRSLDGTRGVIERDDVGGVWTETPHLPGGLNQQQLAVEAFNYVDAHSESSFRGYLAGHSVHSILVSGTWQGTASTPYW